MISVLASASVVGHLPGCVVVPSCAVRWGLLRGRVIGWESWCDGWIVLHFEALDQLAELRSRVPGLRAASPSVASSDAAIASKWPVDVEVGASGKPIDGAKPLPRGVPHVAGWPHDRAGLLVNVGGVGDGR